MKLQQILNEEYFLISPVRITKSYFSNNGLFNSFILISYDQNNNNINKIQRTTDKNIEREIIELFDLYRNPILIGQLSGFDQGNNSVWKSRYRVIKDTPDPLSVDAFDSWTKQLARQMIGSSIGEADHIIEELSEWINFDFDDRQKFRIAQQRIIATVSNPRGIYLRAQQINLGNALNKIMSKVSGRMTRIPDTRGRLAAGFNIPDKVAIDMVRHQPFWIKDRYGNIAPNLSEQARKIIEHGLAQGYGRETIAKALERQIRDGYVQKGYWQTVASNAVARARSYSVGYSYRSAGIQFCKIEAVMDERTTETCLMLHNRLIPVDGAMALQDRILRDNNPRSVMEHAPFISEDSERVFVRYPDESERTIARINSSGRGTGRPGSYSSVLAGTQLVSASVGFPPYHHRCRTTTVAV